MKTMLFAVAVALCFALPSAAADPNAQSGSQSSPYWTDGDEVAVQPGTGFQLHGVLGDFDIVFFDANGGLVGFFAACGADQGTVPSTAATGLVMKWDDLGQIAPCLLPAVGLESTWVYVDGL